MVALVLGLAVLQGWAATEAPELPAQRLCDALLQAMKQGAALGYAGRLKLLTPEIERDLDLPLMTRLVVGPRWQSLTADERADMVGAFSAYCLANYASQFADFSGEQFKVDPAVTRLERGDIIVHTQLVPGHGEPVKLDYLMRDAGAQWRIIDVFLNGTISQLATRRSEYSLIMRESGAKGLADLLRKKATDLSH